MIWYKDIANTKIINTFSIQFKIFKTYFCSNIIFNIFKIILYPSRGNKGKKFRIAKKILISLIIILVLNIYANIKLEIGPDK